MGCFIAIKWSALCIKAWFMINCLDQHAGEWVFYRLLADLKGKATIPFPICVPLGCIYKAFHTKINTLTWGLKPLKCVLQTDEYLAFLWNNKHHIGSCSIVCRILLSKQFEWNIILIWDKIWLSAQSKIIFSEHFS